MIKAVFLDMDGTLISFKTHQIAPAVFDALDALKQQGVRLFIATGRAKDGLSVLKGFPFDGYITLNGQFCFTDDEVLYENTLKKESVCRLLEEIARDPIPVGFQLRDERIFNFRNELVDEIHAITQNDDAPAGDITGIENQPIYQCMIFGDEQREKKIMSFLPDCHSARWYHTFFDLSPKGGTKGMGIDRFLAYYDIPLADSLAIGDGGNDLEMIMHAGHGCAMRNSNPKLFEAAEYICADVDEEGIIDCFRHYGML
jgi:Cof subfamily protein (haloacid dehalogenase superfamily)